MKKNSIIIISALLILLFNTACALEIANVIGPQGGYVYDDKGNYTYGWRYLQCSSKDFGTVKDVTPDSIKDALKKCKTKSAVENNFGWELPDEDTLRKLLECFSYGLTRFSPDYYYLAVNNLYASGRWWVCTCMQEGVQNRGNFCSECGQPAPSQGWIIDKDDPPNPAHLKDENEWEAVILHKNFDNAANGVVEKVTEVPENLLIRVRAIRRF